MKEWSIERIDLTKATTVAHLETVESGKCISGK